MQTYFLVKVARVFLRRNLRMLRVLNTVAKHLPSMCEAPAQEKRKQSLHQHIKKIGLMQVIPLIKNLTGTQDTRQLGVH